MEKYGIKRLKLLKAALALRGVLLLPSSIEHMCISKLDPQSQEAGPPGAFMSLPRRRLWCRERAALSLWPSTHRH